MNAKECGAVMKAARQALRRGHLTKSDFVLFESLMWSCRAPLARRARASLTELQKLTTSCRETIVAGINRLVAIGLLRKNKQRIRVAWGLGIASRQAKTIYEFIVPATESVPPTVIRERDSFTAVKPRANPLPLALQGALDRLQGAMGEREDVRWPTATRQT